MSKAARPVPGVIAITWETHQRTRALCEGLGIPLHELTYSGSRIVRYCKLLLRTVATIRKARPNVVLVQNPSIVLALACVLLRRILGNYTVVMDAHNEAVEPYIHTQWPIPQIARFLLRRADLTIVTNARLQRVVEAAGGRAFVLPDRLPTVPIHATVAPSAAAIMDVMVVSTYAPDEPTAEIFSAARELKSDFAFHVTGRDSKLSSELRSCIPENVTLTGFLPEHEYWELMSRCHLVLDLTLMPECLVCGAYEALALGRVMVLSDNTSGRELFGSVAVFTEPSAKAIVDALFRARARYRELCERIEPARMEFSRNWDAAAARLVETWLVAPRATAVAATK